MTPRKGFCLPSLLLLLLSLNSTAHAVLIGGVEFPNGAQSFADVVVSYNPVGSGVSTDYDDPTQALGVPNYPTGVIANGNGHVSLGDVGGSLVLQFVDNLLTPSGDSAHDLWIFEVGPAVEPTFVDISVDALTWTPVGAAAGATRGINIDAFVSSGQYSYVRLTTKQSYSGSPFAGPDIDAVGAISSVNVPQVNVPEPMTAALIGLGLGGLSFRRKKVS